MKNILYLLAVVMTLFFAGCEEKEVGYLMTDTAGYSIDSLSIFNIEMRIGALEADLADYNEATASKQEELAEWEEIKEQVQEERDNFYDDKIVPLENELYDPNTTEERMREIEELLGEWGGDTGLYGEYNKLVEAWYEADNNVFYLGMELEEIAQEMGIPSVWEVQNEISKLKNRHSYNLPWATPNIESVLGTQPMTFSIVCVSSGKQADADQFSKYLRIIGGGRMFVEQDFEAPAGRYVISIQVENEGHTVVLNDVFTFIVEE